MSARIPFWILLASLVVTPGLAAAQPQTTALPVRVMDPVLVIVEGRQFLDFRVTNDSPLAITAWGVFYKLARTDGTVAARGFSTDVYRSVEQGCHSSDSKACFIPPMESRHLHLPVEASDFSSVNLMALEFAVFADGSGIGDERQRADVFDHRNAEYRGWKQVLSILQKAIDQAGPGVAGARAAIQELGPDTQPRGESSLESRESAPRWQTSGNMRRGIERPEYADRILEGMLEMARQEAEMLERHLVARR